MNAPGPDGWDIGSNPTPEEWPAPVRRFTEQRWLVDAAIRTIGIDWDQGRTRYIGNAGGVAAEGDFARAREQITKLADVERVFGARPHGASGSRRRPSVTATTSRRGRTRSSRRSCTAPRNGRSSSPRPRCGARGRTTSGSCAATTCGWSARPTRCDACASPTATGRCPRCSTCRAVRARRGGCRACCTSAAWTPSRSTRWPWRRTATWSGASRASSSTARARARRCSRARSCPPRT